MVRCSVAGVHAGCTGGQVEVGSMGEEGMEEAVEAVDGDRGESGTVRCGGVLDGKEVATRVEKEAEECCACIATAS